MKEEHTEYVNMRVGNGDINRGVEKEICTQTALMVSIEDHLSRIADSQQTLAGEYYKEVERKVELELLEKILKDSGVDDDGDLNINTMKDLIVNLIKDNNYVR